MTLDDICSELNNWFDTNPNDGTKNRHFGNFTIENRTIDLSETGIKTGQYFRIVGSVYNDGIHQYPAFDLTDETFDGAIWLMVVPQEVVTIASEVQAWIDKYQTVDSPAMSPYTSESFGGYSYSKSGSSGANGDGSGTWQSQFRTSLSKWRKIR